jgi:MSHA biogenesis protein MshJ
MKRYWEKLSTRVEAMTLRERVMVFAGLMIVGYLLMDAVLVSPTMTRRKAALDQLARSQSEIMTLAAQVKVGASGKSDDPDAPVRARLEEMRVQLAALEADAKTQSSQLIPAERMPSVLQSILAARPGLEMVELKTLPQAVLGASGEAPRQDGKGTAQKGAVDAAAKAGASAASGTIYKHGVQLTVRGKYLDLLAYLKDIEALPARLYWDKLELSVVEHPTLLVRVTLYTISLDKAWMQV